MADGTDCPGKDKEIGRGDGSARLSGYVTSEDVDAGRYKPLRARFLYNMPIVNPVSMHQSLSMAVCGICLH